MTGFIGTGTTPVSRMTLGAFADLGYTVDYNQANPFCVPTPQRRRLRRRDEEKIPYGNDILKYPIQILH
jgi:hypothetical protein